MAEFVMMMGLPGSGKSTYASQHFHEPDYRIVSSDLIRLEMKLGHSKEDNARVFSAMNEKVINRLADNQDVVYDATNLQRKFRVQMLKQIRSSIGDYVTTRLIVMLRPFEQCKEWNAQRSGWAFVPEYVMDRMYRSFEAPAYYEGWDVIEIVFDKNDSTEKDFYQSTDVDNFDQDNPHHKLTLGRHLAETANYLMGKDITDFGLITAGLMHDFGKIKTQTYIDRRGSTTEEAHYYDHHNVSAYDAMQILLHDGVNVRDVIDICDLICMHMDPIIVWPKSPRRFNEYVELAGKEQTARVLLLSEADRNSRGLPPEDDETFRNLVLEVTENGY